MARRYMHSLEEITAMILRSAENIVIEEGYAALNARKIAVDIGYTVGSIYMVYDSMSDIVLRINGKTMDEMVAFLESTQKQGYIDSPLKELARRYFSFAQQNENRWRMLFEYRHPKNKSLPLWYRQQVDTAFAKIALLLTAALPERQGLDKERVSRTLWGGIHGIYTLSISRQPGAIDPADLEMCLASFVQDFVYGSLHAPHT